jgi:hypothetical protein
MSATALSSREIVFDLPPAIDIDHFRLVTAGLTRCALEAAASRVDDPAGRVDRRGRVTRAVHANMEWWAVVLHEVLDTANGLSSRCGPIWWSSRKRASATARASCRKTPRSIRCSPSTDRSSNGCGGPPAGKQYPSRRGPRSPSSATADRALSGDRRRASKPIVNHVAPA